MTGYRGVSERKGVWSWFHDLFLLLQRFDVSKLDSFHLRPVSTSIDTLQHVDRWLFNLSLIVKIPRRDPFSHDQLICNMRNIMDLSFFSSTSQNDFFVGSETPDLWGGTSKPAPTDAQYTISLWLVAGSHQSLEESCIEAIGTFQWFRWAASSHLHQLLDRISQQGENSTVQGTIFVWQYLFWEWC